MTAKKGKDDLVYVAVNAYWEEVKITLPNLANHGAWYLSVDTYGDEKGKYFYQEGEEIRIDREYVMKPRSIVVFTGREIFKMIFKFVCWPTVDFEYMIKTK